MRGIAGLALAGLVAAGCGPSAEEGGVDEEACEHLEEGPAASVVAASAFSVNTVEVAADHRRYDIALVDVSGGKGGFVRYASDAAGDVVFFMNEDVALAFKDASGGEVDPEETATSSASCAVIKKRVTVPLSVGTYSVALGPTPRSTVKMVVEEAAHDHDHD